MTTTEIVKHEGNGAGEVTREWIALLEPAATLASQVAGTGFVPSALRGNPAGIVAAILFGDELGIGPMASLRGIAMIEGTPTLYAETQRALILAAGHEIWIDEATNTRVTVSGRRSGSERTSSVTWTLDDAKRANLAGRQNWRTYPRQMLTARATAELARTIFADVIGGLSAAEELADVDELDLGATGETTEATPTRKRRRRSTTLKASPGEEPGTEEPAAPDRPPLPGELEEPAKPPLVPDEGERPPLEPEPAEPVEDSPAPGESPAEDSPPNPDQLEIGAAGGVEAEGELGDAETTSPDSPAPDAGDSPSEPKALKPTKAQTKALDTLVGKLRETEVELEDGSKTTVLSTKQLWASAARRRNVDVDVMIALLDGVDEAGVLHWAPLRDSLDRSEASDLMTKLVDRAQKYGIE